MAAVNFKDLTGQRFGKLVAVRREKDKIANSGKQVTQWLCRCDCGNEIITSTQRLTSGHTTSCGCKIKENKGHAFEDLTGQRFNRLTVIRFLEKSERTVRTYNWLCKCDCGKYVKANASKLKNGLQQSCGCLKKEKKLDIGEVNKKYKHSNKRLYAVYKSMISRCIDQRDKRYNSYGGRGISVCEEWRNDYDAFAEWALSTGYNSNAKHGECTIDRKDVNGNYEPDNCRWITIKEQANNRRITIYLEYKGEKKPLTEWVEILNVKENSLRYYTQIKGMSLEEFLKIKNITY